MLVLSPSLRQIISRALVLCGRSRITSLSDDREDVAIALEMATNVINTCLLLGYFYEGEKETNLNVSRETIRTALGVPYLLPTDFLAIRNINASGVPIGYFLEGDVVILPIEMESVVLTYVSEATVRFRDLFIRYASYSLAFEIVNAIGNKELSPIVASQLELVKEEVAAVSYDSSSFGRGNKFITQLYR